MMSYSVNEVSSRRTSTFWAADKGFTLMEVLIVIAIIGVLVSITIPTVTGQIFTKAKESVDLSNMRTAYSLAQIEMIADNSDERGPYYFTGSVLQDDPSGIVGYGQASEHVSKFANGFPVETTGTPNPTGTPSGANYIVVYCDDNGVSRVSWGGGEYGGKQSLTKTEHETVAANHDSALNKDVELLNSLENAARTMTAKEVKELISKYNLETGSIDGKTCIQIAKCNVKESHDVDNPKTKIYAPEFFEAIGYDTNADEIYIIESRDNYKNGDIIWLCLGTNINNASDDKVLSGAFTYVKSNGDTTDVPLKYDTRKNLNNR